MSRNFSHSNPVTAASQVVLAIRERDWASLELLLSTNPDPGGKVEHWQTAASLPEILDSPEVQTLPPFVRYGGNVLVRFPLRTQFEGQKLEVIVERKGNEFAAIDFWGFGWP